MTIKELCEKYNCNLTAMYSKLKRKRVALGNHVIVQNGIIQIDEYAENILRPGERQREKRELVEKGKIADWQIERANGRNKIESAKRQEAEEVAAALSFENAKLKAEITDLRNEKDLMLSQIAELKHRIEDLEQKPKSIFGRR
ncbi:hypothetical protein [Huintestinicola sp.]